MKHLKGFISEGLKLGSSKINSNPKYTEQPKDWSELKRIIRDRVMKDRDADLNDIDVSNITDMSYLFDMIPIQKIKIDKWDVSQVKNMESMFLGCKGFDCDLSGWDVSRVENMTKMFKWCSQFKGKGLENWKPVKLWECDNMFQGCEYMYKFPHWYVSTLAIK